MMEQHEPIIIEAKMNKQVILTQYLYYKDSYILSQLRFYPLLQLVVIFLYIGVAYLAFSRSRKSEQNLVWAGMAKETAHQIGTPLSSLMAWVEILRNKEGMNEISEEINKDVKRLQTITERFSKVGSKPKLEKQSVYKILNQTVSYLQYRLTSNVHLELENKCNDATSPINDALFEWVIENICKNASDAMGGKGNIKIILFSDSDYLKMIFPTTGKDYKKPISNVFLSLVYYQKKRVGIGLSLSKRIIEEYHLGRLYVKSSSKEGTTFRISLHRN